MSRTAVFVVAALLAAAAGTYVLIGGRDATPAGDLAALAAEVAALESAVAGMASEKSILANELQYTRGLDRHDEALIRNSFWADASVSYGTQVSMDEIAPWANAGHADQAAHQHHVTTLNLDIDGDTAHEEGYILFSSDMRRDTAFDTVGSPTPGRAVPGTLATLGTGRYVNRYARRDGEWRMLVHEYVHEVSMRLEAVDLCATACLGTWDTTDVSYLRPLQPLTVAERRERAARGAAPRAAASPRTAD